MQATAPIRTGDVLIGAPLETIFTQFQMQRHGAPAVELSGSQALVAGLLVERRLGGESPWSEYVSSLPSTEELPCDWTDEELAVLGDAELVQDAKSQRALWAERTRLLRRAMPGVLGDVSQVEVGWATAMVSSRSCYLQPEAWSAVRRLRAAPGERLRKKKRTAAREPGATYDGSSVGVLVPLLDMFNHSPREVSVVRYDAPQRRVELVASGNYAAGEQVFIHYGPLCNRELLKSWGFALEDNEHDALRFELGELVRGEVELTNSATRRAAQLLGLATTLPGSARYELWRCGPTERLWDAVPWQCLAYLQLAELEAEEADRCLSDLGPLADALSEHAPVCACIEKRCLAALSRFITARIAALNRLSAAAASLAARTRSPRVDTIASFHTSQRAIAESLQRAISRTTESKH